jgi:hypothetical protein
MARSRNIKPAFFQNDLLGELEPIDRLAFIGMWTIADYKGCIEYRPKRLKAQILPYDNCDVQNIVINLERSRFVTIYSVQGQLYLKINNFEKHQNPHPNERKAGSDLPDIDENDNTVNNLQNIVTNHEQDGTNRADSLFPLPSSLIPSSLIPDPLTLPSATQPASEKQKETELQIACRRTWEAYARAYFDKHGTEPVRNAKVNSQVKAYVQRVGYEEAPHIAAWFVSHMDAFYVRSGHSVGILEKDCEKLRTEWATGNRMTGARARQVERVGGMADIVSEILVERGLQ